MAETTSSDTDRRQYAKSIALPPHDVFKNLHNVKRFAVDIGKLFNDFSCAFKDKNKTRPLIS